jgi:hypothetical protein
VYAPWLGQQEMNQDDLIIQREVRRILERRAIDATLAVVSHNKGFITISGHIRALRSQPFVKVHDEIALFQTQVMRSMFNIKSISIEAKIVDLPKKERAAVESAQPAHGPTSHGPTRHH